MNSTNKNIKTVVVLSSINWNFLWQRHHVWVDGFLKSGYKVYFVNNTGFRNPGIKDFFRVFEMVKNVFKKPNEAKVHKVDGKQENLQVISPLILPPNGWLFRFLNTKFLIPKLLQQLLSLDMPSTPDICLVYMPSFTNLNIIKRLSAKKVIFDACSNFRGHPHKPNDYETIEKELLMMVDQLVTDSSYLYNMYKVYKKPILRLHQGVPSYMFQKHPAKRDRYRKGIFFGTIDDRLDLSVLEAIIKGGFDLDLFGVIKGDIKLPEGLSLPRSVSHRELAKRLLETDFIIIPYKLEEFNMGIEPAKIYECLATGLPVLAAPLPSLKELDNYLYLCSTPDNYVEIIQNLVSLETNERMNARVELARQFSCEKQFSKFENFILETRNQGDHC